MASVRRRGDRWWLRWKEHDGERWRERSETYPTKREAEARRAEIEQELREHGRVRPRQVRDLAGLDQIIAAYLEHCARSQLAKNTVVRKGQMLGLLTRYLRELYPRRRLLPEVLSYETLSGYHSWLQSPETGRHIHSRSLETCRKIVHETELMWRWAFRRQQRGSWTGVPYPDSLELRREPLAERLAPTWEQMDACIDAAGAWQARLYLVLRCTGLRVQQAMHLRWDDVDLSSATLRIRPGLQGSKSRLERRGRRVPLAPVLVDELATWGRREGWLIWSPRQHRDGAENREARARDARRAWDRAGVPHELRELPHHAFRAGFKTGLTAAGASGEAIDYLTGHSRGINDRYVDPRALTLVDAVSRVPPFGAVVDLDQARDLARRGDSSTR